MCVCVSSTEKIPQIHCDTDTVQQRRLKMAAQRFSIALQLNTQ